MNVDMYPNTDKLNEETKEYLKTNDKEFISNFSEKKWLIYFENKIHGKVRNLINNLHYIK